MPTPTRPSTSDRHRLLGQRLRQLREGAELTQDALADRANIHRITYVRLENGTVNLSIGRIGSVADALDVSLEDLFTGIP